MKDEEDEDNNNDGDEDESDNPDEEEEEEDKQEGEGEEYGDQVSLFLSVIPPSQQLSSGCPPCREK